MSARKHARWALVAVVVAAVAAVVYVATPGEEQRVRARLNALADTLSTPSREPDLARLARMARLGGFFADDAVLYFESETREPVRGRDQIMGLATSGLSQLAAFKVELLDVRIALREGATVADVHIQGRLVSQDSAAPSTIEERAVSVTMTKTNGKWLIVSGRILHEAN